MDKFNERFLYHCIMKYTMIIIMLLLVQPLFSTNADLSGNLEVKQSRQPIRVTGRVMDDNGFPIIGGTVVIKERVGVGVSTDAEGRYTIECFPDETLVYSYIGYISREEKASEANNITVILQEDILTLDEVTIVAFGQQKKESVISSIATVRPEELRVPASNLTTAFAGRMSGVIAYQRSGEPGLDDAEFFIRGITTFSASGKRDPLILIDGIEMNTADLARLNVDDIGSFSVMKDANAAALYGARGANGVILVTTKEGKAEKLSINVRAELSSSANTELVELADPITYMRLHNEAVRTRDPMVMLPYSSSKIRETELGTNPLMYPAVDWYDYLIKDRTFNQRVNINLTGGGQAVQYYLAANYQHDTGILRESEDNHFKNNINLNRIQVRSNVTIKLAPQTTAWVRAYGQFDDTTGPNYTGAEVFSMARNATPVQFLPFYPPDEANEHTKHILFGMGSELGSYTNPLAALLARYKEQSRSMMLIQMEMDHKFTGALEGLFAKGVFNVKRDAYYSMNRGYNPFYYHPATTLDGSYQLMALNPESGTEYLDFQGGSRDVTSTIYGDLRLGYNKVFDEKHDLNALLVGTMRNESGMTGIANNLLHATLPRRNLSSAGRLAYGYDSRYFTEFNFGYNGTERFAKNHRFGFFPSVGAGWIISNEAFMYNMKNAITNLKLKATYGLVGNDQIGDRYDRFFYLSSITMQDGGYPFGLNRSNGGWGVTINRYANDQITWEIAKKTNFGIELGLFDDLSILADYFMETRENILMTRTDIPSTMGLRTTPQANVGVASGKGFEMEMKYQKSFSKDFWTIVNGNFTYATARYKEVEEPDYSDAPWKTLVGHKLNQLRGYIAERFFIDEEDVNNSPRQELGGTYGAGDIKYKDINNDGVINSDDIVPMGHPTVPEIIYGTGFSMGYKSLDISCFFQGSARSSFLISSSSITPFINNGQRALLKYIADDHWSETNRNIYAFWPRLSAQQVANNNVPSTHWLRDGSFVRLKTAELGYTLPERMSRKFNVSMFRVYVSGTNLFHWSNFKLWDPEMAGDGLGYPLQRVFNLGINVNF